VRTTLNNLPAFITNNVKVYNFCKIHHATFDNISKGGPEEVRFRQISMYSQIWDKEKVTL